MSPPELDELTPNDYSSDLWNASEELENPQRCGFREIRPQLLCFRMTKDAAPWSSESELLDEERFAQLIATDE